MKKIKIFLASSNELNEERKQFEIEIYRKCKAWVDKGISLHLDIWEDLTGKMSATRSQDEYNKVIKESDLFVLLAHTKVGIYTNEEFDNALELFKTKGKPQLFPYFKEPNITATKEHKSDLESLWNFQERLEELGHFLNHFKDFSDLWNQFNKELDRLLLTGIENTRGITPTTILTRLALNS